jgi:hypothetical protein
LYERGVTVTSPSYAVSNNGTYNADDPLVAAWWIPGWTAQDKINIPANSNNLTGPGWPTNLAFVNITGNYFDSNSSGLSGYVTLMMSSSITIEDNANYFRLPARLTGTMNQSYPFAFNNWGNGRLYVNFGKLSIQVFATDQTASGSTITTDNGNALFYFVTEHWMGGRTFHIQVPSSDAGTAVDINSLIVPGTIGEYQFDPVFPDGNMWTPDDDTYNTVGMWTGV